MINKENYNPKSRENLKQYNNKKKKIDEYEEIFEGFIKKHKIPFSLSMLKDLFPYNEVFKDKELGQFFNILMLHLEDYVGEAHLKISDISEVLNICQLTILKFRVLKDSQSSGEIKDAVKFIESIDKTIEKVKTNLGANRIARIDPKSRKDITVIDIVAKYENEKGRTKVLSDIEKMLEEEEEITGFVTRMDELIE